MLLPIALALWFLAEPVPLPRFTLTDLGPLPKVSNDLTPGLNADGMVSGWINKSDTLHAHLWIGGMPTDLGALPDFPQTFAADVNKSGVVVGIARSASDQRYTRAFYYQDKQITDMGTLGGKYAKAYAINNQGQIAGASQMTDGAIHAIRWQLQVGKPVTNTDLGVLAVGRFSEAHGINASGHIVGASEITPDGQKHAFFWKEDSGMQDLGLLPGGSLSNARAINDNDEIVGWADNDESELHAFVWRKGTMTDLGSLGDEPCVAWGINNASQIVGASAINSQVMHAFLWTNGKLHDLNDLLPAANGWSLREAYRINDRGQIVGKGMLKGHAHLFLLTPIPNITAE